MFEDLLSEYLGLEAKQGLELKAKVGELETVVAELKGVTQAQSKKIADFEAQDVVDAENKAKLDDIYARLQARIDDLNAVNPTPVTDGLATVVDDAPGETSEAITSDTAIGTSEVTSDEAIAAIAKAVPVVLQAAEAE